VHNEKDKLLLLHLKNQSSKPYDTIPKHPCFIN
jgi:hypothetical protein